MSGALLESAERWRRRRVSFCVVAAAAVVIIIIIVVIVVIVVIVIRRGRGKIEMIIIGRVSGCPAEKGVGV